MPVVSWTTHVGLQRCELGHRANEAYVCALTRVLAQQRYPFDMGSKALQHRVAVAVATLARCAVNAAQAQPSAADDAAEPEGSSALRGLLASPGFEGKPMKSVYFFPGEGSPDNAWMYTAHPSLADDLHWNSVPSTRPQVLDRIAATHSSSAIGDHCGMSSPQ